MDLAPVNEAVAAFDWGRAVVAQPLEVAASLGVEEIHLEGHTSRKSRRIMMSINLRDLIEGKSIVQAPGVWDGMSAKLAQEAGFPTVFASGLAIAASMGLPDADIYTKTDAIYALTQMCAVADVPVLADGDTGFGTAVNVIFMVRDFERIGVQGVVIEDQESPRRCPLLPGKPMTLVSVEEAANKIRAAVAARSSRDFVVIARSDAATPEDMHHRSEAYAEAGADMFFPNAVNRAAFPTEDWAKCHERIGIPLVNSPVPGGWQESEFTQDVMHDIGIKLQWLSMYPLYGWLGSLRAVYQSLKSASSLSEVLNVDFTYDDLMELVSYDEVAAIQKEFIPAV